jgi:hypothetical protein
MLVEELNNVGYPFKLHGSLEIQRNLNRIRMDNRKSALGQERFGNKKSSRAACFEGVPYANREMGHGVKQSALVSPFASWNFDRRPRDRRDEGRPSTSEELDGWAVGQIEMAVKDQLEKLSRVSIGLHRGGFQDARCLLTTFSIFAIISAFILPRAIASYSLSSSL